MYASELSTFGARLRALRHAKGLSQVELARLIGRHQTVIGPYERDEYMPPQAIVEKLAAALQSSPEYLLFGRSPQRPQIPVIGTLGPGGLVATGRGAHPAVALRSEQLLALAIEDDTMAPVYRPGWVALLAGQESERPEQFLGRDVLAELADGRLLLRRLLPATREDRFDLAAYGGPLLQAVAVARVRPAVGCIERQALAG